MIFESHTTIVLSFYVFCLLPFLIGLITLISNFYFFFPIKSDRASIVSGAIDYINELLSTVGELKMLVKKKKFQRERRKRLKMEDEMAPDMESSLMKPLADGEQSLDGPMRSSWLLRKSNETVIDVRIIDDEVNIKLTQRRKVNCLLLVAEVLDELQMELLHATGGNIGDYSIFMFNTKVIITLLLD